MCGKFIKQTLFGDFCSYSMKLHHWLFILASGLFIACQNNQSTQTDEEATAVIPTKQECYTYIKNKDTASLSLMSSGAMVTGELDYELYEKDSNHGLIKGEMRGDTLVADYTFGSEGTQSIRQVAFLKKDGQMLEGFGDVVEENGKMIFKSISTLKFGDAIAFTKVNCK